MKIRLTPLNIVCAVLLTAVIYLIVFADKEGWRLLGTIPLLVLAVVSFAADMVFRRAFVSLRRIWIVELVFIIFAVVLMLLIRQI